MDRHCSPEADTRCRTPASPGYSHGASENPSLPPARREPALDMLQPVMAPEGLAVDDERRAEDAAGQRLIGGLAQLCLGLGLFHTLLDPLDTEPAGDTGNCRDR